MKQKRWYKYLCFGIMWVALSTMLVHAIIPHHHHNLAVEHCNKDFQHIHGHESSLISAIDKCVCSQEESHTACHFNDDTLVAKKSLSFVAILTQSMKFGCVQNQQFTFVCSHKNFYKQNLYRYLPKRAPPVGVI